MVTSANMLLSNDNLDISGECKTWKQSLFRKVAILLYFIYLFIILVSLHIQKFTFPYFLPNIIPSRSNTESENTFVWYFGKRSFVCAFYYFVKNELLHKYFFLEILLGFLGLFISNFLKSR